MRTGIPELRKLLGCDELRDLTDPDALKTDEIRNGSIVLIRGGPGSGKTTLALQLIDRHLKMDQANRALFISLESKPKDVVNEMNGKFGFQLPSAGTGTQFGCYGAEGVSALYDHSFEVLPRQRRNIKEVRSFMSKPTPPLVVIDSLNLLMGMRLGKKQTMRERLSEIHELTREWVRESVLVLTSEFHGVADDFGKLADASFACDVEIYLGREPVAGEVRETHDANRGLGYDIERSDERYPQYPQGLETRPFCRVVKSRSGPNQARRLAYDILPDRGMVFFERYPGDGKVLLFTDNGPQDRTWNEFFQRDIPHNYPALRHERFDRKGLQRTFASQRGFRHMPARTDLYVATFDTYWVNWYIALCQKWRLADLLGPVLERRRAPSASGATDDDHKSVPRQICETHRDILKTLGSGLPPAESTNGHDDPLKEPLRKSAEFVHGCAGQGGLLTLIPEKSLRLFGELRSEIIWELDRDASMCESALYDQRPHPVHRPMSKHLKEMRLLRSVPYNANIGVMVYRVDLQNEILARTGPDALASAIHDAYVGVTGSDCAGANALAKSLARDLKNTNKAQTWEEVIALCKLGKHHLLIETQTFDTFLCTYLELLWGCGGDITVDATYSFGSREKTHKGLLRATQLLDFLFKEKVVLRNSSLEAPYIEAQFRSSHGPSGTREWLFARHWYSTLVDVLTAKSTKRFAWSPPEQVELGLIPIPVSMSALLEHPDATHISCWGEWHLGILGGSENIELGLDVINNIMSSQKICERAFECAAIPTVEEFYRIYGDAQCLNLPERQDIVQPSITFDEFREMYFINARSRDRIFDYRHCMRNLHAVLESVHAAPGKGAKVLGERINQALDSIQRLAERDVLHA